MSELTLWLVFALASSSGYFFRRWRRERRVRLSLAELRLRLEDELLQVKNEMAAAVLQRIELTKTLRALHHYEALTPSAKELAAELARVHERWAADQATFRDLIRRQVMAFRRSS